MRRTKAEYHQEVARNYHEAAVISAGMVAYYEPGQDRPEDWLSDAATYQRMAAEQYGIARNLMGLEGLE